MIKAEMLNEMNPKLRALLAAGLIGTASLGAASCSMPTDDPTIYEQPAPETPANPETPDDPGNTVETVTFESLGVQPEYFASLAGADKFEDNVTQITVTDGFNSFRYKNNDGFVSVEFNDNNQYEDGHTYMSYINDIDDTNLCLYYVPVSMESKFDQAIAAYKAAHAE